MADSNSTSRHAPVYIKPAEKVFAWSIMAGAVSVSVMQASSYYWSMAQTPLQQAWLVGTVIFLLLGSQCLVNFMGKAIVVGGLNAWQWSGLLACGVVVFALECFSIDSSREAMQGRIESTRRAQNQASPEYQRAMESVRSIERQIADASKKARQIPSGYVSKYLESQDRITALQDRLQAAQDRASAVNVSTVGGSNAMVTNMAVMLSVTPLAINFSMGALVGLGGMAGRRESNGKKPAGAARLHAVG